MKPPINIDEQLKSQQEHFSFTREKNKTTNSTSSMTVQTRYYTYNINGKYQKHIQKQQGKRYEISTKDSDRCEPTDPRHNSSRCRIVPAVATRRVRDCDVDHRVETLIDRHVLLSIVEIENRVVCQSLFANYVCSCGCCY
jgi:hypothetical protein